MNSETANSSQQEQSANLQKIGEQQQVITQLQGELRLLSRRLQAQEGSSGECWSSIVLFSPSFFARFAMISFDFAEKANEAVLDLEGAQSRLRAALDVSEKDRTVLRQHIHDLSAQVRLVWSPFRISSHSMQPLGSDTRGESNRGAIETRGLLSTTR